MGGDMPAIVDFWAPGCSPCLAMEADFFAAAEEFKGGVQFVRVNTHSNQEVAEAMGIRSVPTVVVFRGAEVFDVRVGRSSKKGLQRMAQRVFDKEQGVGLLGKLKRFLEKF